MRAALLLLLLLGSSAFGQMARPTVTAQAGSIVPLSQQIRFTGVTITAPSYTTNSSTFTLNAIVSPITSYNFQWTVSGVAPGSVTFAPGTQTSTNATVTVGGNGNYDFLGTARTGQRFAEVTVSVAVSVAANTAPTISSIPNVSTNEDFSTYSIPFTIGDDQTAPGSLMVLAVSSNPNVLPNSSITLAGSGGNRTITLTPLPNSNGVATVTVSVTDGSASPATTQASFTATWLAINDLSALGAISSQALLEDHGPLVVPFTLSDADTALSAILTTANSTNSSLVPNSGLVCSGTGASRTLSISPALHTFGTNTITLAANDGIGSSSVSFSLAVVRTNYPPLISSIANATVQLGQTRAVSFNAQDVEDSSLSYSATSTDTAVLPVVNITFSGSGSNRVATLNPLTVGATTVQITALDSEGKTASSSFTFTVSAPPNTSPTVTAPANQTIGKNTATGTLTATVADAETPVGSLVLSALSSNPTLLPQSGISLGGSTGSRSIVLTPATGQIGTATIVLTVADSAGATGTASFSLTVTNINQAPTITAPATATGSEDLTLTIPIAVADPDGTTPVLTATSSNPALVPNSVGAISIPASGSTRNVVITPAANAFGTATLTWQVSDGSLTAGASTVVTIQSRNDLPTIAGAVNRTIGQGSSDTQNITVGDVETPDQIAVTGLSSDTSLVPNASIVITGVLGTRTVTVTPNPSASGNATITLTATDPQGGARSINYLLTVSPPTGGGGTGNTFFASLNGGSNSNPGTNQAAPWNLSAILDRTTKNIPSGAVINILPGTYTIVGNNILRFSNYDQADYITIQGLNRVWGPSSGATIIDGNNATRGDGCIDGTAGSANRIRFKNIVGINSALRQTWPSGNTDRRNFVYWTSRGDVQFVNCWSQDSGNGFGFEDSSSIPSGNALFYGNVSCLNGSPGDDDAHHGHNFYVQCKHLTDRVDFINNVSHNACGQGWQVRTGDEGIFLANTYLYGNIFFNNGYAGMDVSGGQLRAPSPTRNLFFGGGERARNYSIVSNFTYYALPAGGPSAFFQNPTANTSCSVGGGTYGPHPNYNTNLFAVGNAIIGGELEWGRWINATITNNLIAAGSSRTALIWMDRFTVDPSCPASWTSPFDTGPLGDTVDWNFLFGQNLYSSTRFGGMTAAAWKANTTFGDNDIVSSANGPSTNIVVLFPNAYDSKLALLVVYNPSGASTVSVNLGSFLNNGDPYDIYSTTSRTARHSSGVAGGNITIPMTGFPLTAMTGYQNGQQNLGGMRSPEPFFGCFTVIKTN